MEERFLEHAVVEITLETLFSNVMVTDHLFPGSFVYLVVLHDFHILRSVGRGAFGKVSAIESKKGIKSHFEGDTISPSQWFYLIILNLALLNNTMLHE